jgi:glycosyltransferase involved in cell wall biosynthesis
LSISLLEALSYGNCVLISDIPENVEVSGDCAVAFKSKDVADLKSKLQMLLADEGMVNDYRKRARQCVQERYDWEKVVDSTERLYESVRNL